MVVVFFDNLNKLMQSWVSFDNCIEGEEFWNGDDGVDSGVLQYGCECIVGDVEGDEDSSQIFGEVVSEEGGKEFD